MSDTTIQSSSEAVGPSVGQTLKAEREARGLSVNDVAEKLKLTVRQLAAIESDDYDLLPGNTFARGFVRNYARLLDLDPQSLLDRLVSQLPQERVQAAMPYVGDATALNAVANLSRQGRGWPLWVTSALGLVLGIGAVVWYLQKPPVPDVAMTAPASAVEAVSPVASAVGFDLMEQASDADAAPVMLLQQENQVASTVDNRPASAASAVSASALPAALLNASKVTELPATISGTGPVRVVTEFDSWVQVVDAEGKVLISQLMRQGMEQSISGKAPYKIKIGNAPKTQLFYRGQRVDLAPHTRADVATLELK